MSKTEPPEPPTLGAAFRAAGRRVTATVGTRTVTITAMPPLDKGEAKPKPNRKPAMDAQVSRAQWAAMEGAFDHFNAELFDGKLPPVMLNFSRHANCYGFFAPNRWYDAAGETVTHEISLNPAHLRARDLRATYSTLVHEMVHLWQEDAGKKKSKRGYHNGEWADAMERVGLLPTTTGLPGGERTGYKVTHMVIDGGAYDRAFETLAEEHKLPWLCEEPGKAESKPRKKSKVKYTCTTCMFNVWAKPNSKPRCGEEGCDSTVEMECEDDEDEDDDQEAAAEVARGRLELADRGPR